MLPVCGTLPSLPVFPCWLSAGASRTAQHLHICSEWQWSKKLIKIPTEKNGAGGQIIGLKMTTPPFQLSTAVKQQRQLNFCYPANKPVVIMNNDYIALLNAWGLEGRSSPPPTHTQWNEMAGGLWQGWLSLADPIESLALGGFPCTLFWSWDHLQSEIFVKCEIPVADLTQMAHDYHEVGHC